MRRVGVFGGTFDPVHLGHLILAEQCREAGRLDEVWFVPAGKPPHKQDHEITRFEQRVEMIELAIAGQPAFRVDAVERELSGITYTAAVLEELHRRHPGDELFLLIGSDSLNDLPLWYQPQRVVASAALLVMLRTRHPAQSAEQLRQALHLPAETPLHIEYVPQPPVIDIASHDLRQRVREGRSIRYLVPRAVECYIQEKGLYRAVCST
jgi:nicotinate-nucleotide adenylyltransferase